MSHTVEDFDDFDEAWSRLKWPSSSTSDEGNKNGLSPSTTTSPPQHRLSSPRKSRTPRKSTSSNYSFNNSTDNEHLQKSWRDQDAEKENTQVPTPSPLKSHGSIAPEHFYRPPQEYAADPKQQQRSQELKETIEKNLLTQEKLKHKEKLDSQRRAFRKVTSLKMWPLQDLAMEHLDHLLDTNHSLSQFHGGEYLSSESSSSTGSATHGGKRRHTKEIGSPLVKGHATSKNDEEWLSTLDDSTNPLWSREPRIFATEKAQGKRKYLVGHFGRIADWYWRKCVNKHLYEVIREKVPCRLYFDLEYSKEFNPDIHEEDLMNEFREELAAEFQTCFHVILEPSHMIDMDSSTDTKFSRHWIIDLDHEGFFEDAPTAGRFVKRFVGRLAEEVATNQLQDRRPTLAKSLFVQTKDAKKPSCFIDLGVYTRNRLFRCLASSKYGKINTLQIANSNQYPMTCLAVDSSKLDTNGASPDTSHLHTTTLEEYIKANDWAPHASSLAATLVIPLGGSEGKRIFRVEEDDAKDVTRVGDLSGASRVFQAPISIHSSKSPLPTLEKYVLDVLGCRGGTPGAIRAWSLEYGGPRGDVPMSITYQLCRNRYCELVGRAHKSNNIYWTIILDTWTCIQGCHDPECFGRGSPVSILEKYLVTIRDEYERWKDEEFEKALMALNLDELPSPVVTMNDDVATATKVLSDSTSPNAALPDDNQVNNEWNTSTFLSDEALLEAIGANPELFP